MSEDVALAHAFSERYGPWALVLGGSEGIGECFARRIAHEGVNLVLVARRAEPLARTAAAVGTDSAVEVRTVALDLTAPDALAHLVVATDGLEVGLVVANAGASTGVPEFLEASLAEAERIVRLNCLGPVQVAHTFGAPMVARGRGGMIFVSSMAGLVGAARTVTYGASKAFDLVFAEGLWAEWGPRGVDVLALVAGATDTPALAATGARYGDGAFPAMSAEDVAREALERLGDGPTCFAGDNHAGYEFLRSLSRAEMSNLISAGTRALYGFPDPTGGRHPTM